MCDISPFKYYDKSREFNYYNTTTYKNQAQLNFIL